MGLSSRVRRMTHLDNRSLMKVKARLMAFVCGFLERSRTNQRYLRLTLDERECRSSEISMFVLPKQRARLRTPRTPRH